MLHFLQVFSDDEEEWDQPKPIFQGHLLQLSSIETGDSPPRDSMQYKSDGTESHLVFSMLILIDSRQL